MLKRNQNMPDQETFKKLQKEISSLTKEKESLENRFKQLIKYVTQSDEVRKTMSENHSLLSTNQVVHLFLFEKMLEKKSKKVLERKEEYREDCNKLRERVLELLQAME